MPLGNEGSGTVVATGGGSIAAGARGTAHVCLFCLLEYCTWEDRDVLVYMLYMYFFIFLYTCICLKYMFESAVQVFQR